MIKHKRGATFSWAGSISLKNTATGQLQPLAGAVASCQLRTITGELIEQIDVQLDTVVTPAIISLRSADTSAWQICEAEFDIRVQLPSGDVLYTPTQLISIIGRETV